MSTGFERGCITGQQATGAALLRFVTSCRAAALGFGSMQPPFTIQRVGILRDGDKLLRHPPVSMATNRESFVNAQYMQSNRAQASS
jgi:hypothetical protein